MAKQSVLFIYDEKELALLFERECKHLSSWNLVLEPLSRRGNPMKGPTPDLIILESKNEPNNNGYAEKLLQLQGSGNPPPILLLSALLFKKNPRHWVEVTQALLEDPSHFSRLPGRQAVRSSSGLPLEESGVSKTKKDSAKDPLLGDFVERKFKEFVKKIRASKSSNLYPLLLKEIEKPLISLTLHETKGNQSQAATILGMNRNTLRKKIKELKIPVKGC